MFVTFGAVFLAKQSSRDSDLATTCLHAHVSVKRLINASAAAAVDFYAG